MGENIDEFDEFPAIRQYFSYQNFPIIYLLLMNLWRSGSTRNKIISVRCLLLENHNTKALFHTTQLSYNSIASTITINSFHNSQFHTSVNHHTSIRETNQCMCHDVISRALCHAPVAIQKGVADLCLQLMHMHTNIKEFLAT